MIQELDFTYCPKCSGCFQKKDENLLICNSCQFEYYINPKPCNAIIIENKYGEILLVRRAAEPQKGWWDLPGGFIDINETAEESVEREAFEELQVKLKHIRYFMSTHDVYNYKDLEYKSICFTYCAEISSGEPQASDDASEYIWMPKSRLNIDEIAFEGLRTVLRNYLKK